MKVISGAEKISIIFGGQLEICIIFEGLLKNSATELIPRNRFHRISTYSFAYF